ncbi:MAG: hypothetical protein AAGH57_08095 [Pseudomonadota bacterium]
MNRFAKVTALIAVTFALAGCEGAEDATESEIGVSVEEPAEAALAPVIDEPVEDEALEDLDMIEGPPAVSQAKAAAEAEAAALIAAEVEEAAAAAEAAEEASEALDEIDDLID